MAKLKNIIKSYKNSKKSSFTLYAILRLLIIICMIIQIFRGELENAFLCFFSLILFLLPIIIQDKFKIELPNVLEIVIFLFIFASTILGEIYNFYGNVPHWDTTLHTINGFICAGIGFALVDLLNKNSSKISLSPFYISFAAFCFSMTVGVCWEFVEYGVDSFFNKNMQKDTIVTTIVSPYINQNSDKTIIINDINKTILYDSKGNELTIINGGYLDIGLHDTTKDLIVNFIGAVIFSVLGYFYINNRDKYKFTKNFIPISKKKTYNLF
jgi:hypothetical protein